MDERRDTCRVKHSSASITLNLAYTPSVSNGSEIARDIVSEAGWEDGGGTDGWRDGGMEGGV